MSSEDTKKTVRQFPFQLSSLLNLRENHQPIPQASDKSVCAGFIGLIRTHDDPVSNNSDVSVTVVVGKLTEIDKGAIELQLGNEYRRRIRSVTEYRQVFPRRLR
ncbi:MAG: hypothetical protein V1738_03480 [Patescibacteria group bacterium]